MRSIPDLGGIDSATRRPLSAMKESIEELRGITGEKIKPLSSGATQAEIIAKVNEIITRLQG